MVQRRAGLITRGIHGASPPWPSACFSLLPLIYIPRPPVRRTGTAFARLQLVEGCVPLANRPHEARRAAAAAGGKPGAKCFGLMAGRAPRSRSPLTSGHATARGSGTRSGGKCTLTAGQWRRALTSRGGRGHRRALRCAPPATVAAPAAAEISLPLAAVRPAGRANGGLCRCQAWWEKWGERYDTRGGNVFKWTDKWAESGAGIRRGVSA